MNLRPATSEDLGALVALEADLFGGDAWSASLVSSELTAADRTVALAEDEGIVGYAVVRHGWDVADLLRIGVRPDHRRQGVATSLLEAAVQAAGRRRASRMLLEVAATNVAALGFYARAGFVEIDRRRAYYQDGTDAVVMRRSLGAAACGARGVG